MRLLDRYLLRELLKTLGMCLAFFMVGWITFDLFDKLSLLQEHKLHGGDVIAYELVRTPEFLGVVLPVSILLAALYALTQHARHHELTAIRAAGVSLGRLAAPYVAVGLGCTVGLFAVSEFWAPRTAALAERILFKYSGGTTVKKSAWEKVYFVTDTGQKWAADFNRGTQELREVNIDWPKPDGSRVGFFAKGATRVAGGWGFTNVQINFFRAGDIFPANRVFTNVMRMPEFTATPQQIVSDLEISRQSSKRHVEQTQIPLRALYANLKQHPQMAAERRRWVETQIHSRLAAPWTCLVVVGLAIPFGAASGRRNVFVGVAGSIFICFLYFVLLQLGLALGAGGQVPPWLGAWLPNLLFGAAGLGLTFKVR